mmetsp:Transcript_4195/g.8075  ORF Transcript_4195/g.8075 Transcript_4195/m.8075 type:complete len:369 (-) Transcript_4195:50-1156(-)
MLDLLQLISAATLALSIPAVSLNFQAVLFLGSLRQAVSLSRQRSAEDHEARGFEAFGGYIAPETYSLFAKNREAAKGELGNRTSHLLSTKHKRHCQTGAPGFTRGSMQRIVKSLMRRNDLSPKILRLPRQGGNNTILVLDSFLSREEARTAAREVKRRNGPDFKWNSAFEYGHQKSLKHTAATGFYMPEDTPLSLRTIRARARELLGISEDHVEPLIPVRIYKQNDTVDSHTDQVPPWEWRYCGRRIISFLVHLADAEGGETVFRCETFESEKNSSAHVRVAPKAGRALIFTDMDDTSEELNPESTQASLTSAPVHWGDPVRGGEKILLTLWFRQYPYREAAGNHCCDPPRAPRRSLHGGSVLRRVFK